MFGLQGYNSKKKLCFILIILSFFTVIYFLFLKGDNKEIIILRPNYLEFKIKASGDQNLVQNLNADKTIYDSFAQVGTQKNSKVNFLPAPETPLIVDRNSSVDNVFNVIGKEENKDNIDLANNSSNSVWDVVESDHSENETVKPQNSNILKITNLVDKALYVGAVKKDHVRYFVQLAYSRSQKEALNIWNRINSMNKKYLKNFTHSITKQKRGGSVFYELYVGPFSNFREAKHLCGKLKLEKHKCLVIKK